MVFDYIVFARWEQLEVFTVKLNQNYCQKLGASTRQSFGTSALLALGTSKPLSIHQELLSIPRYISTTVIGYINTIVNTSELLSIHRSITGAYAVL